jgi:hypothetical protein
MFDARSVASPITRERPGTLAHWADQIDAVPRGELLLHITTVLYALYDYLNTAEGTNVISALRSWSVCCSPSDGCCTPSTMPTSGKRKRQAPPLLTPSPAVRPAPHGPRSRSPPGTVRMHHRILHGFS